MATATERVVVQVTADQKQEIATKAQLLGMNISELMRQGALNFVPQDDDEDLAALAATVDKLVKEADQALDDAMAFIEASNQRIAAMREGKH